MEKLDRHFMKGGATTLILSILSEEPMHGYQLTQTIKARSDGIFALGEGTIYPLLYSLQEKGLVRSVWEKGQGGRRRKVYSVTPRGQKALERRMRQWSLFARGMELITGES